MLRRRAVSRVAGLLLGLLCATGALPRPVPAPAHAQPTLDRAAAADPILQQLEAFRRDDYDAAYAFASAEIRRLFDRIAFEDMVRSGYPEIAKSARARVVDTEVAPDGRVRVRLHIRGVNGHRIQAVYEMVQEGAAWKINGVIARPDPGEEA
jgi:hypothetical protein